jgi:hypothetical protein
MRKFYAFFSLALLFLSGTEFQSAAQTGGVPGIISLQSQAPKQGLLAINQITPSSGVAGASVTVSGQNFGTTQGSSTITFNGIVASVVMWNNWTVIANVPAGNSSGNVVVTVGGTASNGFGFKVVTLPTPSIVPTNFGFQCGLDPSNCGNRDGTIVWPDTQAQPQFLRLHDAETSWSDMSTGPSTYDWTMLDTWLDTIAQHRPLNVIEVFSWVPCWDAPTCEGLTVAPTGTNSPPNDLTANGSPTFTDFVTQFVQHCSAAGNCAGNCPSGKSCKSSNLIRFYELWNEWNTTVRWTGTITQLYQMIAPVVPIIRANVTKAVILTPSTTSGAVPDFQAWLNLETTNGRISDWVVWHDYLSGATPEQAWSLYGAIYLSTQVSLPAWKSTPWADTETNFNTKNYLCPTKFSKNDCTGQIVRWQLLHSAAGAMNLNWYKWNQTIGSNTQYEPAYYNMMQYLESGKFGGPCTSSGGTGGTWTCNFTESNGATALWVWTPNEAGLSYTVPSGYVDYLNMTGGKTTTYGGQSISIGTIPILLEQ